MRNNKQQIGDEMRDYKYYTDYALELWEEGFNSKASKKRCLEKLSYAFENIVGGISGGYSTERMYDQKISRELELYWAVPHNLFQWSAKKIKMHTDFYNEGNSANGERMIDCIKIANKLAELRVAVKETEIVPPIKSEEKIKKQKIEKTIEEIMERHNVKFLEAYSLTEELFPLLGLQIYVNSHWVTNQFGTTFIRNFFYLNDKLTALHTIMAVAQKHERNHPELYKENK
tara:strand:- start:25 stop:714 length:690 start_codon:yes stop_codon:yes gene_type:complete